VAALLFWHLLLLADSPYSQLSREEGVLLRDQYNVASALRFKNLSGLAQKLDIVCRQANLKSFFVRTSSRSPKDAILESVSSVACRLKGAAFTKHVKAKYRRELKRVLPVSPSEGGGGQRDLNAEVCCLHMFGCGI
jgi:hypothetical protein